MSGQEGLADRSSHPGMPGKYKGEEVGHMAMPPARALPPTQGDVMHGACESGVMGVKGGNALVGKDSRVGGGMKKGN